MPDFSHWIGQPSTNPDIQDYLATLSPHAAYTPLDGTGRSAWGNARLGLEVHKDEADNVVMVIATPAGADKIALPRGLSFDMDRAALERVLGAPSVENGAYPRWSEPDVNLIADFSRGTLGRLVWNTP